MTARLTLGGDKLSDHGRGAAALLLEGDLGDDDVVLEDGVQTASPRAWSYSMSVPLVSLATPSLTREGLVKLL